jgi:tRNA nucleotidyltransferase (CCA-adding enzyme)
MDLKKRLVQLPASVQSLIHEVSVCARRLNLRIYLVGGIVRDMILNRENFDLDIVVEGNAIALGAYIARHLNVDYRAYQAFGTAVVFSQPVTIDLAMAREETYPEWGTLPVVRPSTLREDLKRRDFTINAIAVSLNDNDFGALVDFYAGRQDVQNGLVRILHEQSFFEDPTRIMRAIRFKERFGFRFEPATLRAMKSALSADALSFVSEQRLRDELELILREPTVIPCIRTLDRLTGFSFLPFDLHTGPELHALLKRIEKATIWFDTHFPHKRPLDVWLVYLMGLLYRVPTARVEDFLDRFGFRRGDRLRIKSIRRPVPERLKKARSSSTIYKILEPLSFEAIIFFYALTPDRSVRARLTHFLDKLNDIRLAIGGRDLQESGIEPRVLYNAILERTLHQKLDGKVVTREQELAKARQISHGLKRAHIKRRQR